MIMTTMLAAKRTRVTTRSTTPATIIGVLFNPANTTAADQVKDLHTATRTLGQTLQVVEASTEREIKSSFATPNSTSTH